MTPLAIVFMLIAMVIIWGGLAVAITFLVRNPLEDSRPDDVGPDEPLHRPGTPR